MPSSVDRACDSGAGGVICRRETPRGRARLSFGPQKRPSGARIAAAIPNSGTR